jgi:hypothetical protein
MGIARRAVRRPARRVRRRSVRGATRPVRYLVTPRSVRQAAHTVHYPIEAALRSRRRSHGGWLLLGGTGAKLTMLTMMPWYWAVMFWLALCILALVSSSVIRRRW